MAKAGLMTDVTQKLFAELKSTKEETRVRAACELYDLMLLVSRGMGRGNYPENSDLC